MSFSDQGRIPRQFARPTTAERKAYTGAPGEPTFDVEERRLYMQDGSTQGGIAVALSGDTPSYAARVVISATPIPAGANYFRVAGYATSGDGGEALYKRIPAPGSPQAWHIQSGDGAWWVLASTVIDIRMLGCVGDGATVNPPSVFVAALAAADTLVRPVVAPGVFVFSGPITYAITDHLVILFSGRGRSILRFRGSGATNGLSLTYSDDLRPPQLLGGFTLTTDRNGIGTALTIDGPAVSSSTSTGPLVEDPEIRGENPASQCWLNGIEFIDGWYARVRGGVFKGKDEALPPFTSKAAIRLTRVNVAYIDTHNVFHADRAVAVGGGSLGEGIQIQGGEWVGVNYGLVYEDSGVGHNGTVISGLHVNAYTTCLQLASVVWITVSDCLLFKTHLSTLDWTGIALLSGQNCNIHDNTFAAPSGSATGAANCVLLIDSTDNKVTNNTASYFSGSGAIVGVIGSSDRNEVWGNKRGLSAANMAPAILASTGQGNIGRNNMPVSPQSLPSNTGTPSVGNSLSDLWITANSTGTAITRFANGYNEQRVTLMINDVSTSFVHNTNNMLLKGNANIPTGQGAGSSISFIYDGSYNGNAGRWVETARSF